MEVKNLKDADLFNLSLLVSDWQQSILTEIRSRPSMGRIAPLTQSMDIANKASERVNELILQAFKFDVACQFGEHSDDVFSKVITIVLANSK